MRSLAVPLALALNAFFAGGMFTFPLMSPVLAASNHLSQPQLTTIILAGMMSQYPVAVVVGTFIDRHGPALCALVGGGLFTAGFGAFAHLVSVSQGRAPSQATFAGLVATFLLIGLGTVCAYCSALFAASKYFPRHMGFAAGATMSLFALSPLFFSLVATHMFVADGVLDVPAYALTLALATGTVALFSASTFTRYPIPPVDVGGDIVVAPTETTALLARDTEEALGAPTKPTHPATISALLRTVDFWLLALFCVCILGASEMVISNIGAICASLPAGPRTAGSEGESAAREVRLLAVANTAARLLIGPLADVVAPPPVRLASGIFAARRISRFAFLAGAAALLSLTFAWMGSGVHNQAQLWALSIGTGLSYSATFTVIPSLISSMWGLEHLGRNFGLMMYAPFTGTPLFSYLYASVSSAHVGAGDVMCRGRACWQTTFGLSMASSVLALLISFVLWRRWRSEI